MSDHATMHMNAATTPIEMELIEDDDMEMSMSPHTRHGLMIDAGSTGSRLHVYEFEPRVVSTNDPKKVKKALDGSLLTLPTTHSKWTERLSPGLATFAAQYAEETELQCALAAYLEPLLTFATHLLKDKSIHFQQYPIYLRATAGMRLLPSHDRDRVMNAVRTVLSSDFIVSDKCLGSPKKERPPSVNRTPLNPFLFTSSHASVLSGEEEAVYGWAGANYLMGTLLPEQNQNKDGSSPSSAPLTTYGALDMGGASTQISFIHSSKDIMSNLFNLHLGGTQHWGVYTNSFLHYGINEAQDRVNARLVYEHGLEMQGEDTTPQSKHKSKLNVLTTVSSPCLPGGSSMEFTSNVKVKTELGSNDADDSTEAIGAVRAPVELPAPAATAVTYTEQPYTVTLANAELRGDFDRCAGLAQTLLLPSEGHHNSAWCEQNECSVSGSYQPSLPTKSHLEAHQQNESVEFIAFSAYNYVWDFLNLPPKATMRQLQHKGRHICQMTLEELVEYNSDSKQVAHSLPLQHLRQMCFRAAYTFEILHHGYGFQLDDHVTAIKTLQGREMGWALGAMLYEINTLPWEYIDMDAEVDAGVVNNNGMDNIDVGNGSTVGTGIGNIGIGMASPSPASSPGSEHERVWSNGAASASSHAHVPTPFEWVRQSPSSPANQVLGVFVVVFILYLLRITSQLKRHNQQLTHTVSSISLDLMNGSGGGPPPRNTFNTHGNNKTSHHTRTQAQAQHDCASYLV
jgi:Golgi nucleoside diphosphatase